MRERQPRRLEPPARTSRLPELLLVSAELRAWAERAFPA